MKKYGFEDNQGTPHTFRCPLRCLRTAIKYANQCTEIYGGEIHLECDAIPVFIEDTCTKIMGVVDLQRDVIAERTQAAQGHPLDDDNAYVASVCAISTNGEKLFRRFTLEDAHRWFGEHDIADRRQASLF